MIKRFYHKYIENQALDISFWFVITVCSAMVFLEILARFSVDFVLDDSYMFVRYADHVISQGTVAWNPGGPPTFGLTSPLFLLIVVPVRLLTPGNPALTVMLSSLVSGISFLFLAGLMIHRMLRGEGALQKLGLAGLAVVMTLGIGRLAPHFTSGMDTMFVLASLTLYIILVLHSRETPGAFSTVLGGAYGGALYFVRPDLVLFSIIVPLCIALFSEEVKERKRGKLFLGISLAFLALDFAFASLYFGSVVPLPFYAKGLKLYGENIYRNFRGVAQREFVVFLLTWWLLFLGTAIAAGSHLTKKKRLPAFELALLIASTLFLGYYVFFVWQIMHYYQRFYYPTLPALIEVSAFMLLTFLRDSNLGDKVRTVIGRLKPQTVFVTAMVIVGFLAPPVLLNTTARISAELIDGRFMKASLWEDFWKRNWFKLDEFSKLPDDLTIASTEVGHPGVLNPGKTVIDLAGLNDAWIAQHGLTAQWLFETYKPDLIYFPHRHYQEMIRDIEENPYFREHYQYFPAPAIGVRLGVALWQNSKHYAAMRKIMENPSQ